jgi:hypothetical protein
VADRGIYWENIKRDAITTNEAGDFILKDKMHFMTKGPEIILLFEKNITEINGVKRIQSYNKYSPWNCESVSIDYILMITILIV